MSKDGSQESRKFKWGVPEIEGPFMKMQVISKEYVLGQPLLREDCLYCRIFGRGNLILELDYTELFFLTYFTFITMGLRFL